jgi:hypothetical protein
VLIHRLRCGILRDCQVLLWAVAVVFFQEVIQPFRDIRGQVSLIALLAYICRDIPDDN